MKKNLLYIGNKLSGHGYTSTSIETLGFFLESEGYNLKYASSKKNKLIRLFDMVISTIRYAPKTEYVLIDTYSTQNFWYAVIISQLCRILNLKYIAKLHGGDLPNRLIKTPFFCDLLFNNAYKITAPSAYLLEAFRTKYSKNLVYIPNTIELEKYNFFVKKYEVPKLLWVRSFSKIYNPKMAMKALMGLNKKYPNAVLCMVGPDKENLIEDCKLFAKKNNLTVQFTGKLDKEDWIELSKDFNVFINTTHFDNTPVSVIEAMALGIPVVSTNVGGIPFLLNHKENALLVDDDDSEAMIESINLLFSDEQLRTKIINSARSTVEDFDWNSVKHKWFDVLS